MHEKYLPFDQLGVLLPLWLNLIEHAQHTKCSDAELVLLVDDSTR